MRWLEQGCHAVLFLLFAGYTLTLWPLPWVNSFEQVLDDTRVGWSLSNELDDRIVIVDIDEASLASLGQWPWSRQVIADLLETLVDDYQVKVVGLDFVLAEPTASRVEFLQALAQRGDIQLQAPLEQLGAFSPEDTALAQVLQSRPIVTGIVFKQDNNLTLNSLPSPLFELDPAIAQRLDVVTPKGYTGNLDVLTQATANAGFFDNPQVDSDGVYRRATMLQQYENNLYPSLALAVARVALSQDTLIDVFIEPTATGQGDRLSIDYVQLGRYFIPTSGFAAVRVPFHHREQGYAYVSATDVVQKRVDPSTLRNKIVLVGTTAPGLKDIRNTSVNSQLPGVEVHANIIRGILDNQISIQPDWHILLETLLMLTAATLLWWVYRRRQPWVSLVASLIVTLSVVVINLTLWQKGLLLALSPFVMMVGTMYVLNSSWELFVENFQKRRITQLFGQYVPKDVVNDLTQYSEQNLLSGTEQELTVLFSDVRGFTTLAENLKPNELTSLMNKLLTPLTNTIHQQNGTIDKYMGDAIMAFWGAPIPQQNHASLAVKTALAMQQSLSNIQQELRDFNVGELAMGIGINTGPMCVGNMGSEFRMAYTVMGDAVNLGSRLEALTRQYGVETLVSESVTEQAPEFLYLPVDCVRVKGKTEPVSIFVPLSLGLEATEAQKTATTFMTNLIKHYQQQQWEEAELLLSKVPAELIFMATLKQLYQDRIDELKTQTLPDNWDGVYTHKTKS